MLPAQKEETVPANPAAPQLGGFGKVLNSIQGLQQRLDDFSVEDVSRAQAKAENLIRELSLLQLKLTGLAVMGQALTDVRRTVEAIPDENFDLADAYSLEKYPTLHALAAADKLVQLVRVRAHSFAIYIDQLNAERESAAAITVGSDQESTKGLPSSLLQLEASPAAEANATVVRSMALTETDEELVPAATAEAPQIVEKTDLLPPSPIENDWQTRNVVAKTSDQGATTATFAEHPQDETRGKKTTPAANSNFNQRLLDDLIHNYGDFAGSPNLSVPRKAPKPATQKASEHKIATVPLALTTPNIASTPREVAPVDVAVPEEVSAKVRQIEITPSLEAQQHKPAKENVTGLTKQGEIDRQLKSIIKDYGEYDLYQRHSPLNLKVAGVLAFALLALVLGGFYFLKSPASETFVPAKPAVQSEMRSPSVPPGINSNANSAPGRASGHEVTGNAGTGERPSSAVTSMKQKK
jgi:hypothetical protein